MDDDHNETPEPKVKKTNPYWERQKAMAESGDRACSMCGKTKPIAQFYKDGQHASSGETKVCYDDRIKQRARMRKYHQRNGTNRVNNPVTEIVWQPGNPGIDCHITGQITVHAKRRHELAAALEAWASEDDVPVEEDAKEPTQ